MNAYEFLVVYKNGNQEVADILYIGTHIRKIEKIYLHKLDVWIDANKITDLRAKIIVKLAEDANFYNFGEYIGGIFEVLPGCIHHYNLGEVISGTCNGAKISNKELIKKYRLQALI